jgi:hypothetical protein
LSESSGNKVGDMQQECLTLPENAAIIPALLDVEANEIKIARKLVLLQVVVTLIGACAAYSIKGTPLFAIAVLSGGGVSVVNGGLLALRMNQAVLNTAHEAHHQLRLMYYYAAERFLVVVVLLCFFIAAIRLSPLGILGGFVVGQVVLSAGRLILSCFKTEIVTKNV